MTTLTVLLSVTPTKYPSRGVTYDHTEITVDDGVNPPSSQSKNGNESPAWTGVFTIADTPGKVTVLAMDSQGNPIGAAKTQAYDASVGSFPGVSGITVTIA
jgi:hypothetical protein